MEDVFVAFRYTPSRAGADLETDDRVGGVPAGRLLAEAVGHSPENVVVEDLHSECAFREGRVSRMVSQDAVALAYGRERVERECVDALAGWS